MVARAFILCGDEERFAVRAQVIAQQLSIDVSASTDVEVVNAATVDSWSIRCMLAEVVTTPGTLLLAYTGHGAPYGLAPKDHVRIHYADIAQAVAERADPTLIVNDACYSDALVRALEHAGANPERVGVISACDQEGFSYGRMLNPLLRSWRQGKPFTPMVYMIFGRDASKPDEGTYDHYDAETDTLTCHISGPLGEFREGYLPDSERRWGTTAIDAHFSATT